MNFNIITNNDLEEVKIINVDNFEDLRGKIFTSYRQSDFVNLGLPVFTHDKIVISNPGVLRGIHGDFKTWKLVSCIYGSVEQVVVDCRPDSKSFKKWLKFNLNEADGTSVLIPPGFGNAFLVTNNDKAIYNYKLSYPGDYNDTDEQFTYKWNDPEINIDWSINNPILSNRDK
jgi:dTDP-4-dehydrorhamnose 3,5-epimerase